MAEIKQDLKKAYIRVPAVGGRKEEIIKVLYNPAEYTIEKSNQFQSAVMPGMALPVTQFVSGNADTLTMELFFDTYTMEESAAKKDVRELTGPISKLLDIDSNLHAPPVCEFIWGEHPPERRLGFKAIIERLTQKFTMFTQDGTPVRATLNVTFKEYKTIAEQLVEIGRKSADRTKRVVFKESDSLWKFAADEYGDPDRWRLLAEKNNIDNPRLVEPGRELVIPPLET